MVNWIVSSSCLIVAVLLIRHFFKGKINLCFQYALWGVVAVRLLVPFNFGNSVLSIENLTNNIQKKVTLQTIVEQNETNFQTRTEESVKIYNGVKETDDLVLNLEETKRFEIIPYLHVKSLDIYQILFLVWIMGIVILSLIFLLSNICFERKIKNQRRKIEVLYAGLPVYTSEVVDTPCLAGVFHPCIYVTEAVEKDTDILRHTVFHEMNHYKHGDLYWAIIRCICLALHWYNPLVWRAAKMSIQDAELACDEATIKILGENERLAYGRTLIQLTCEKRQELFVAATTMTSDKKSIKERISMIAKKPKLTIYAVVAVLLVSLITVGCTFTTAKKAESVSSEENSAAKEDVDNLEEISTGSEAVEIKYFEEPQENKVCLAVMPDGISKAGGDYRYIIPEDQKVWVAGYKQMCSMAKGDGKWRENERSMGIWIVFNDEWTCLTEQGFICNLSERVEKSDAESFYELCLREAEENMIDPSLRPENITKLSSATLRYNGTYKLTDSKRLSKLQESFASSEEIRGGAACPFTAGLSLEFENGEIRTIFLATDSCDAWLSSGVYYEYAGYEDIEALEDFFVEYGIDVSSVIGPFQSNVLSVEDVLVKNHDILQEYVFQWISWKDILDKITDDYEERISKEGANGRMVYRTVEGVTYILPEYWKGAPIDLVAGILLTDEKYQLGCGVHVGMQENDLSEMQIPLKIYEKDGNGLIGEDGGEIALYLGMDNADIIKYDYAYSCNGGFVLNVEEQKEKIQKLGLSEECLSQIHFNLIVFIKNKKVSGILMGIIP